MAVVRRRCLVPLEREIDVYLARERAAGMARSAGFDTFQCSAIETAVSEVCSNAIRHGERGWASLRVDESELTAVVTDEGPGFAAVSDSPGLKIGLAGAQRLMGRLEIERLSPRGSRVTVSKPLPTRPSVEPDGWVVEVATRNRSGRDRSGDLYWVGGERGVLMVAVVDGLGSGDGAAEAAEAVAASLSEHAQDGALDAALRRAHLAATSTRGAVATLVRIGDPDGTARYAGVGDVSGAIGPPDERLMSDPGILGVELPGVSVREVPWGSGTRLILWTDGIALPADALHAARADGDWVEGAVVAHGTTRDDGLLLLATRSADPPQEEPG